MSVIEYSYDAAGNRTQKVEGGVTTTYEYDVANQLVSSQTGSSTTLYAYDLNGNLTSETTGSSVTSYEWDEENRLAKVTSPDGSSETYTYSAGGLRKKKVVATSSTTDTTLFLWDGQNILLETDENNAVQARYTNPPEGYGPLLSMKRGVAVSRYGFDTQNNARVLVGGSQSVSDSYTYSGFGEEFSSTGTTANPHRFGGEVGYYTDKTSRLYARARHYQPKLARWMSNDPIGYGGGDWNFYRYASNNPINLIDPNGLRVCGVCGPEVGHLLRPTMNRVLQKIRGLGPVDRGWSFDYLNTKCKALYHPLVGFSAWDIANFHDPNYDLLIGQFHPKCSQPAGANTDCGFTVSVNGVCHKANQVNYLLWGLFNRVCQDRFGRYSYPKERMFEKVILWKELRYGNSRNLGGALDWASAGFNFLKWIPAGQSKQSGCQKCKSNPKYTRKLFVYWLSQKTENDSL